MPPDRRRRRFRRPDTGRWLTETFPSLRIELASQVRATLTAWMRLYGEANDVLGLATGPIETRFARLRENTAADSLIVWTTPGRWATGEGLSLRFPQLHLEFTCSLGEGHLVATKVAQMTDDAREPEREPGAVGVLVHAERIPLPPEDVDSSEPDVGVDTLEQHFAHLAGRRWGGFAAPLSAALEAEAREDEARTQRLTVPFKEAALAHGGEEDVWRLKGVAVEALRALDDGEWLEILDDEGRSRTSARVVDTHPGAGTLVVGVRTASDPPRTGFVRPRSRKKILEQKRALLEELASPTGSLPNLVRLVAAPASMPTPRTVRPPRFVNPAVVRNRSQARAVGLALGLEDGEALLIQGPPGTGKSTTAAEIDVQLILRDPGVRILVCSHSNHGTDNMLMKVLPFLDDAAERIARIGFYERIAKEARPFYAGSDADLSDRNIIFTTIDALVLQDAAGARVYDYVIVDEANRAGVLDSLLALARGRRMIMVGDPMQLQPVMSEAEQHMVAAANGSASHRGGHGGRPAMVGVAQPGAQHVIGKSLFAWIQERRFAPAATVLLDQQNRMHPAIGELVSRVFYSNHVRTGPAAPRRGTGLPAFPAPVTWVDTRALKGNVESRAGGTSLFNLAEARLVTSITTHLASQAPPNLTIGVITAYAEQRDLLRRLMGPHAWPAERQLEVDTVDAFEGREKDIIVLSLVRANRRRDIGFLRLEQRLNVAISRSRRLLIVVGDISTLREGFFGHLIATAQAVGQIVAAPKLIGQFLTRVARPRRERDDRRREGVPGIERALPMAGESDEAGDGETEQPAAEAAGVAAAATAGQDAPGGVGSRRRRRRAWERRRERLRSLHERHQHAGLPAEGEDSGTPAADWAQPGPEPLGDGSQDAAEAGAAPSDETPAPGEIPSGDAVRRPRPRRRRRFGVPLAEARSSPPAEALAPVANSRDEPSAADSPDRSRNTTDAAAETTQTPPATLPLPLAGVEPVFGGPAETSQTTVTLPVPLAGVEPMPGGPASTRRRTLRTRAAPALPTAAAAPLSERAEAAEPPAVSATQEPAAPEHLSPATLPARARRARRATEPGQAIPTAEVVPPAPTQAALVDAPAADAPAPARRTPRRVAATSADALTESPTDAPRQPSSDTPVAPTQPATARPRRVRTDERIDERSVSPQIDAAPSAGPVAQSPVALPPAGPVAPPSAEPVAPPPAEPVAPRPAESVGLPPAEPVAPPRTRLRGVASSANGSSSLDQPPKTAAPRKRRAESSTNGTPAASAPETLTQPTRAHKSPSATLPAHETLTPPSRSRKSPAATLPAPETMTPPTRSGKSPAAALPAPETLARVTRARKSPAATLPAPETMTPTTHSRKPRLAAVPAEEALAPATRSRKSSSATLPAHETLTPPSRSRKSPAATLPAPETLTPPTRSRKPRLAAVPAEEALAPGTRARKSAAAALPAPETLAPMTRSRKPRTAASEPVASAVSSEPAALAAAVRKPSRRPPSARKNIEPASEG